jgi:hypothetical protein
MGCELRLAYHENKMSDGEQDRAPRAEKGQVATISLDRTAARCSLHRMVRSFAAIICPLDNR